MRKRRRKQLGRQLGAICRKGARKLRGAIGMGAVVLAISANADGARVLKVTYQRTRCNRDWQPEFFKAGSEPRGFRGVPWGVRPKQLRGLKSARHECGKHLKAYARARDRLRIGKAQVSRIRWCFLVKPIAGLDMEWPLFSNRLVRVDIELRGEMDFETVKKACMRKYGKIPESGAPGECDIALECYVWQGDATTVRLRKMSDSMSDIVRRPPYELTFEYTPCRTAPGEPGRDVMPSPRGGRPAMAKDRQAEKETEEAMRDL